MLEQICPPKCENWNCAKHVEIACLSWYLLCAICIGWSTIVATGSAADAHDAGPQTGWSGVVATGGEADAHDAGPVTCGG